MEAVEELQGTIERLLFQNEENGFSIFVLQTAPKTTVVVKGYLPQLQPGQAIHATGAWVTHPKFGRQFEARQCSSSVPTTKTGLTKYLGSGLIKGIGPVYAEKLVAHFGTRVLEIIDKNPAALQEVPGIGQKRIDQIIAAWQDQKQIATIMVFLQEKEISPAYATKIYKKYGQESLKVVTENPYRLAEDIWGIGFKIADKIAQNIGVAADSLIRLRATMLFVIGQQVNNGHLYVEVDALKQQTLSLLNLAQETVELKLKQVLHELYNEGKIKLISHNNMHYVTLSSYYFSEKGVAVKIANLRDAPYKNDLPIDEIYHSLRSGDSSAISLNDEQQQAIMTALQNKVTIITGGPGTGKTTVIKQLLTILDAHKKTYSLAAPTGRAAKRITQGTGRHALTIHRLLEFDFITHGFTRNEHNALKLDFLIIDEASMIDIFLAHAVLRAVPLTASIIFIGDVDQLPSVGAGNFLHDLIASGAIPCTRLTTIFRQAQDSLIIVNAHRINKGEFPVSSLPDAKKDFVFIKEEDPATIVAHLEKIFTRHAIDLDQTMVLLPMQRSTAGTQHLNQQLQNLLNPDPQKKQIATGAHLFKEGDRVMQLKNNYDKRVFNGDIGTIATIDTTEKTVSVTYPEQTITYEFSELDELVLAYAITIHKSQGSEYKTVIIALFMQHFTLLQRNLIYTAVTRAKKLCILIGQPRAIAMGIKNNKGLERISFLTQFLTTDLQCR